MKNKDIDTWVEALRSGEYEQCTGRLCRESGDSYNYCCLGVMFNELVDGDWVYDPESSEWSDPRAPFEGMPSDATLDKVGLSSGTASILAGLNDYNEKSFEEIADWIEGHREDLVNEG